MDFNDGAKKRKTITYITPNGYKCRDNRLHEEKYLKENMLHEFRLRQSVQSGAEQHDAEFKALSDEIAILQTQLQNRNQSDADRQDNRSRLDEMLSFLEWTDFAVTEYNDALVRRSVERVNVICADKILVKFKWGAEYEVALG